MLNNKRFGYFGSLIAILILSFSNACKSTPPTTPGPIHGVDEPIHSADISLTVREAHTRRSYQTHYIMTHAPDLYIFYEVIVALQGADEPEGALEWGIDNLKLIDGEGQEGRLDLARWMIVGDNVQYKSGTAFDYRYVYIYKVLEDSDFSAFYLQLADGQTIELASIYKSQNSFAELLEGDKPLGPGAVVGGGTNNFATATHTTIGGGELNAASAAYSSIGGGRENRAENYYASIGGGYANTASGRDSTIGGGSRNSTNRHYATVGGGIQNLAHASNATIAGGAYNHATDVYATICGGTRNLTSGYGAFVGGGAGNLASGDHATSSGGLNNQATGDYAAISGGYSNLAEGDYSFAAGKRAIVNSEHPGVFIFADSTDMDFLSQAANEFAVRASGGARIVTATGMEDTPLAGVRLPSGSGSWESLSDRDAKTDLQVVDENKILEQLSEIQITTWRYKNQDASIRHIGPIAQDFYAAFDVGEDGRYISSIDADGVALAAIQGLYQRLEAKEQQIQSQQHKIEMLEQRLTALERSNSHKNLTNIPAWVWLFMATVVILHLNPRFFDRALIKN